MSLCFVRKRYIDDRCAAAGPCDASQVREEAQDRELARALRGIVLSASRMELLMVELRRGQAEVQRSHKASVDQLDGGSARIQRPLDQMYVDKRDGLIDADTCPHNARP